MAPSLSLPAVTLGLGLSANAYFFFGNLAAAQMGIASLISSPEKRKRYAFDAGKSSELFDTFYHYAAPRFGGASLITTLSYLGTAFLKRNDFTARYSTSLLYAAGTLALFPLPWTVFIMMPTNKSIMAKAEKSRAASAEVSSEASLRDFDQEIQKWVRLNLIRFSVLGVSYVTALYSLLI